MTVALANPDDEDFDDLDIPELRKRLTEHLGMTVSSLYKAARIMQLLERRGDDVSDIVLSFRHHLRRIASGQMLPDVMLKFAGREVLTSKIGNLPLADQKRLVDGEPIQVFEFHNGEWTHRLQDPSSLNPKQIRQVFATDHIRTEAEQRNYIVYVREKESRPIPAGVAGWRIDDVRKGVYIGRKFIPRADIAAIYRVLERLE